MVYSQNVSPGVQMMQTAGQAVISPPTPQHSGTHGDIIYINSVHSGVGNSDIRHDNIVKHL